MQRLAAIYVALLLVVHTTEASYKASLKHLSKRMLGQITPARHDVRTTLFSFDSRTVREFDILPFPLSDAIFSQSRSVVKCANSPCSCSFPSTILLCSPKSAFALEPLGLWERQTNGHSLKTTRPRSRPTVMSTAPRPTLLTYVVFRPFSPGEIRRLR